MFFTKKCFFTCFYAHVTNVWSHTADSVRFGVELRYIKKKCHGVSVFLCLSLCGRIYHPPCNGTCLLACLSRVGFIPLESIKRHPPPPLTRTVPCGSYRVFCFLVLFFSTNAIFRVVVRCGGFRALYGWLGDVWERVRAHKLPRAGPPEWQVVGGRVYVEELLCVLARVPISVDMLRETVKNILRLSCCFYVCVLLCVCAGYCCNMKEKSIIISVCCATVLL